MSEHEGDKPEDEQGTAAEEDEEAVSQKDTQSAAAGEDEDVVFPEEEQGEEEPSDIEKARAERDRMRDQLLRIAADFDNFRKRSRKEIEEVRRRTIEDTLRDVLPIIDNLERAAEATKGAQDVNAVAEGIQMVLRGFEEIANRIGLRRVKSVGQQFDPTVHDAMQQEETDQHAPGTIVAEVVPGYELGERLLRPAMVVVARPPSETGDENGPSEGDDPGPDVKPDGEAAE